MYSLYVFPLKVSNYCLSGRLIGGRRSQCARLGGIFVVSPAHIGPGPGARSRVPRPGAQGSGPGAQG